jgi:hypothetical protein
MGKLYGKSEIRKTGIFFGIRLDSDSPVAPGGQITPVVLAERQDPNPRE